MDLESQGFQQDLEDLQGQVFPSNPYHPLDLVDLGAHRMVVDLEALEDLVDLDHLVTLDFLCLREGQEYPGPEDQGLPYHQTGLVILVVQGVRVGLVDQVGLESPFQVGLLDREVRRGRGSLDHLLIQSCRLILADLVTLVTQGILHHL